MNSKKYYGQFYTTNVDYILSGIDKPTHQQLIEPFVGEGDILKWVDIQEIYDIDPKIPNVTQQDTLLNPPDYKGKYVVTNPPYLLRNKNKDKTLYDKYKTNDLYKVCIKTIVDGDVDGGILIIPFNFMCSSDHKIRDYFFSKYKIINLNVFEEPVFDDTDIPICAFNFTKIDNNPQPINITFFPTLKNIKVDINRDGGWMVGGHLHKPKKSNYKIGRLLIGQTPSTTLYLYATDTGSMNGRIRLVQREPYYGKDTDRNFATITSNYYIDEPYVISEFNKRLEFYRREYNSLFLTNFRNSTKHYTRKRIQFKLAFNIIKEILEEKRP